jgi:hypothetical protein
MLTSPGPRQLSAAASSRATRRVLALAATCLVHAAHAGPWTAIGSTGVPDETVAYNGTRPQLIATDGMTVSLVAGATQSAVLRFNVSDTFGTGSAFVPRLTMRFLDSSAATRLRAVLKTSEQTRGLPTSLVTLDTATLGDSPATREASACGSLAPGPVFGDFDKQFYWVEVTLSRSSPSGEASLVGLRIDACP